MLEWLMPRKRGYIDKNKVRAKKVIEAAINQVVEYGTEDDAVELLKTWNPNPTPKEVQDVIILFRQAKSERAR